MLPVYTMLGFIMLYFNYEELNGNWEISRNFMPLYVTIVGLKILN